MKDPMLDHDYDGIRELDNPLPGWWLTTFYITIAFAAAYFAYYHMYGAPNLREELEADMQAIRQQQAAAKTQDTGPSEGVLLAVLKDPARLASGGKVYAEKCASCHGARGEGSIGPNLTDNHWIHHRGAITGIAKVIAEGVLDRGMPPWKTMLKEEEVLAVAAFVKSLHGSNPPNGKAPQGEEVKE
ncbi:MAG: c-type cytochrome [Bdellovibrionales bacterium]|nr:c-type cytochrome [Bdellovibrionales bacterium]